MPSDQQLSACAYVTLFLLSVMVVCSVGRMLYVRWRLAWDTSPRLAEWAYTAQTLPTVSLRTVVLSAFGWTAITGLVVVIKTLLAIPDWGELLTKTNWDGLLKSLPVAGLFVFTIFFVLILVSHLMDRIMATQPVRYILTEDGFRSSISPYW